MAKSVPLPLETLPWYLSVRQSGETGILTQGLLSTVGAQKGTGVRAVGEAGKAQRRGHAPAAL